MKKLFLFLFAIPFLFINCSDDDDGNSVTSTTYTLAAVNDSAVSGTAKFTKVSDTETRVEITLEGTPADGDHPAHIHAGSVATPGAIAISLTNVDGATGTSTTMIENDDTGAAVTYEQLIDYNGYINIHLSPTELMTIVAQGDIGSNTP